MGKRGVWRQHVLWTEMINPHDELQDNTSLIGGSSIFWPVAASHPKLIPQKKSPKNLSIIFHQVSRIFHHVSNIFHHVSSVIYHVPPSFQTFSPAFLSRSFQLPGGRERAAGPGARAPGPFKLRFEPSAAPGAAAHGGPLGEFHGGPNIGLRGIRLWKAWGNF